MQVDTTALRNATHKLDLGNTTSTIDLATSLF